MTKPFEFVLSPGDFGFADSSESLEDLARLDDLFTSRPAGKAEPSMHATRPDGLVAGSCGPLSRSPEHLVGYGYFAPEGDRRGRWQFSPEQPFRATKIYTWAWKGEAAAISSLLFGSDEQLVADHPAPADLFASWVSPKQFLELYAGVENPRAGNHRVLCKHLPGQMSFMVPLHLPTIPIGSRFEVAWTGPLHAFFVCGRELLQAEGRKGSQGSQGEQESEGRSGRPGQPGGPERIPEGHLGHPTGRAEGQTEGEGERDARDTERNLTSSLSSPPGRPGRPGCPSSLRAGTKDTTV